MKLTKHIAYLKAVKTSLIIAILLLVAGGGYYTYRSVHTVNDLNASSAASMSETKTTKLSSSSTTSPKVQLRPAAASTVGSNTFTFKELGIQIIVPDSVKDIVYSVSVAKDTKGKDVLTANISNQHLTAGDAACSTEKTPPLGFLRKVSGTATAESTSGTDNSYGQLVKQFTGYYIAYTHSQSACGQNAALYQQEADDALTFVNALPTIVENR